MQINDYQIAAIKTAVYPEDEAITYPALGLAGEVGEFCNKWKKVIREDDLLAFSQDDMCDELGDILWYLSALARDCELTLEEVAQRNLEKLRSRQERGVLKGSGDNR